MSEDKFSLVKNYIRLFPFVAETCPDGEIFSLSVDVGRILKKLLASAEITMFDMLILSLYSEGFKVYEIAEITGKSRSNISSRLNETCQKIADLLPDDYGGN